MATDTEQSSALTHESLSPVFNDADRASFYRVLESRRDMRHFTHGQHIAPDSLQRILMAAYHAPSVGLMQPWRYIHVENQALREHIAQLVEDERNRTAEALGSRKNEFLKLKVEGVKECAALFVLAIAPDDGTVFGRRTLPYDTALSSVACSMQNFWLAARAENLGVGCVSLFDPMALGELLEMPPGSKPIAILCLGPVEQFYSKPMLELEKWRDAKPLSELVYRDKWGIIQGNT